MPYEAHLHRAPPSPATSSTNIRSARWNPLFHPPRERHFSGVSSSLPYRNDPHVISRLTPPTPATSSSTNFAVYDVRESQKYFDRHKLDLVKRTMQVAYAAASFSTVLLTKSFDRVLLGVTEGNQRPAEALQALLTRLGPTCVKLGQVLSMRPDLVGEEYAASLAKLQDKAQPFPTATAFAVLEEELGRPISEVFASLSAEPVASASLGQVYRGVLHPQWGGQDVAVKVQRPGAAESIALDFYLLRKMVGTVQRMAGITRDLRGLVDEVATGLQGECDFREEAANAAAFARAHAGLSFVTVPRVVAELTSQRVMVSEWVDGRSPTQLLAARKDSSDSPDGRILSMVRMGIQCSLAQLLVTGCMHGDPHSGNLMLTPDGRLCYLDFGLIVRVPPDHRQAMMAALVHLGLGEWAKLVTDLKGLELLKPGTDEQQLAADLKQEFEAVLASAPTGAEAASNADLAAQLPLLSLQTSSLSFGVLAGVLFRCAYKYRFLLPSYFPLVVRAVASLEGVALLVDPNFKLVSAGMPVVLNQLLSDRRPGAQALLQELLLSPSGALRTDDTTQQILSVWLSAAQQAAASEGQKGASGRRSGVGQATVSPGEAALDMTSLLTDPRNVTLRRTLLRANPATTIASMPRAMQEQLQGVLTQALCDPAATTAAAGLMESSATARAQRKRLAMLFKASVPMVMNSPPRSILQLIAFTASVITAVCAAKVKQAWEALRRWIASIYAKLFGNDSTSSAQPQV